MSSEKFFMPKVSAGTVVKWSPGNGSGWVPAIVSKVSGATIAVAVLRSGATSFISYDAVRHVGDPYFAKLADPTKTGVWDYTDETKLLAAIAKAAFGIAGASAICPSLSDLLAAYTTRESTGSDPDYAGA